MRTKTKTRVLALIAAALLLTSCGAQTGTGASDTKQPGGPGEFDPGKDPRGGPGEFESGKNPQDGPGEFDPGKDPRGGQSAETAPDFDLDGMDLEFTDRDRDGTYKATGTKIVFSASGANVTGAGASADGSKVTVTKKGTYILSGSTPDGSITVSAPDDAKVQLVLDGLDINSENSPAIFVSTADKVFVTLAAGSKNTVSDGVSNAATDGDTKLDGAIFSRCDITFNGTGELTVNGRSKHGIVTRDDLVITGGKLTVKAKNIALSGRDNVKIAGGDITLDAGSDGIRADNDGSEVKGFVYIAGGTLGITSVSDGIQAYTALMIDGGNISVTSGGKGARADGLLSVSGGEVLVKKSQEGFESAEIDISGGKIAITASDDGLNATGRSLTVSGGYMLINASGDGIDSNGTIAVSGGVTLVSGPTNGGNGALDYEATASVTGGVFIACGSKEMAMNFSSAENQGAILVQTGTQKAGTSVAICDPDGRAIVSFTPEKQYQCVTVTAPGIKAGGTYTVVTGAKVTGADENGFAENASLTGGTTVSTVKMTSSLYGSGNGMPGRR